MDNELEFFESDCEEYIILEDDTNEVLIFEDGTGGTNNYEHLSNQPKINDVTLIGNKTSTDLKLQGKMESLSNTDIENLLNNQGGNVNGKIFR